MISERRNVKTKKYVGFREQFIKCHEIKGRIKEIRCLACGQRINLCTKYKDMCRSSLCFKERTGTDWKKHQV